MARRDRRARLTGRASGDIGGRHVRLYHWLLETPAWADLDTTARAAYLELAKRYNGSNNGRIALAARALALALNVSPATAARAMRSLADHGFIVVTRPGAFHCKVRLATEYRLTEFQCDVTGTLPSKEFASWRKTTVSPVIQHCAHADTEQYTD